MYTREALLQLIPVGSDEVFFLNRSIGRCDLLRQGTVLSNVFRFGSVSGAFAWKTSIWIVSSNRLFCANIKTRKADPTFSTPSPLLYLTNYHDRALLSTRSNGTQQLIALIVDSGLKEGVPFSTVREEWVLDCSEELPLTVSSNRCLLVQDHAPYGPSGGLFELRCINLTTGKAVWQRTLPLRLPESRAIRPFALLDKEVWIPTDEGIERLSAIDGQPLGIYKLSNCSTLQPLTADDGTVFLYESCLTGDVIGGFSDVNRFSVFQKDRFRQLKGTSEKFAQWLPLDSQHIVGWNPSLLYFNPLDGHVFWRGDGRVYARWENSVFAIAEDAHGFRIYRYELSTGKHLQLADYQRNEILPPPLRGTKTH